MSLGVLEAVGNVPLVRLDRLNPEYEFNVFAKLEYLNPAGSIKDRPALQIIQDGLRQGIIRSDSVVIESSSGNMGIGLAQICRYLGLRFICVVDSKTTHQNRQVLGAYGAEIEVVSEPDPESGELLQARLRRVKELMSEIPEAFWPNQYANRSNPAAHYRTTIQEIWDALDGRLDYLFVATSTCGTLRGCGEFIRDHDSPVRLVAVDAEGSRIFKDESAERRIPGLGAGFRPPLCDLSLISRVVHVTDRDAVIGCRRLVSREAILAGGSAGGVVAGLGKLMAEIPAGSNCVVVLCDRGERYLDTIYSDDWVAREIGDIDLDEGVAPDLPNPSELVDGFTS